MMKKTLLLLSSVIIMSASLNAQISLIGSVINSNSGNVDIITWDALDTSSVQEYPSDLTAYFLASSVFDAYNGNYYLTGIAENSEKLFSFNTKTLEQNLVPFTNFSNITEIDMSTGKIYDLSADAAEYIIVNEYDIETGEDSLLGVIYEPGTNGIIVDAIAFNSNDGILFYLGYDSTSNHCLYSIPVRNDDFSFTKTTILTDDPISNFFSINYDNVNNILFALNSVFDSAGNFIITNMTSIDPETGEVTIRSGLSEFSGFVAGSACFDQNSGSYITIAVDTNFAWKMMIFDTYTNTYITGWAPDGVSEIACDNTEFATERYITTTINDETATPGFSSYPNPANNQLTVMVNDSNASVLQLYDLSGKLLISKPTGGESQLTIDVNGYAPGIYMLHLSGPEKIESQKIMIR